MTTIYEQLGMTAQEFLDQHDLVLEFGSGKAVWVRKEMDVGDLYDMLSEEEASK